jgi:hypothetical protein
MGLPPFEEGAKKSTLIEVWVGFNPTGIEGVLGL